MALFGRLKQKLHTESILKEPDIPLDLPVPEYQMGDTEQEKRKLISLLTPRETDLYYLLLEGYTLKESAKVLSVKYSTANTHMTAIYKKLRVNSRAELIIKYRDFAVIG
jgi:DNA-binding CsgD family transcriptional regulator